MKHILQCYDCNNYVFCLTLIKLLMSKLLEKLAARSLGLYGNDNGSQLYMRNMRKLNSPSIYLLLNSIPSWKVCREESANFRKLLPLNIHHLNYFKLRIVAQHVTLN